MSGSNALANDNMVKRLETELREQETFVNGIIERANSANRDISDEEKPMLVEARGRMAKIKEQIDDLEDIGRIAYETRNRAVQVDQAIAGFRGAKVGEVEYRSFGQYAVDVWKAKMGDRESAERLEVYYRAAAHQRTSDNPGIVPDPIVGEVINFIDAARPIVGSLGPRPLTTASWHRPKVTGHTAVGKQGAAGAASDEKSELVSQKMTISRIPGSAVTYGGYVNVSRQDIDFSNPSALDLVQQDLAAQYSIETEAATGDLLATTNTSAVNYDLTPSSGTALESVARAVWSAAAKAYTAVRGQGRLILAVAPDVLEVFGPLFAPVNPQNGQGSGFAAGLFGQGGMGNISQITTIMSAGLGSGEAFMYSTAAVEVYEQRVGALQVIEPSVAGVQIAYVGYFTPMLIEQGGVVPVTADGS